MNLKEGIDFLIQNEKATSIIAEREFDSNCDIFIDAHIDDDTKEIVFLVSMHFYSEDEETEVVGHITPGLLGSNFINADQVVQCIQVIGMPIDEDMWKDCSDYEMEPDGKLS